jgi:hypothetical protein
VNTPQIARLPREAIDQVVSSVPLGRIAEVDEIACAALFLASDESAFVTGIELFIDGGAAQGFLALERSFFFLPNTVHESGSTPVDNAIAIVRGEAGLAIVCATAARALSADSAWQNTEMIETALDLLRRTPQLTNRWGLNASAALTARSSALAEVVQRIGSLPKALRPHLEIWLKVAAWFSSSHIAKTIVAEILSAIADGIRESAQIVSSSGRLELQRAQASRILAWARREDAALCLATANQVAQIALPRFAGERDFELVRAEASRILFRAISRVLTPARPREYV